MDVGDVGKNIAGCQLVNFHRRRWKKQLRDLIEEIGIGQLWKKQRWYLMRKLADNMGVLEMLDRR